MPWQLLPRLNKAEKVNITQRIHHTGGAVLRLYITQLGSVPVYWRTLAQYHAQRHAAPSHSEREAGQLAHKKKKKKKKKKTGLEMH